MKIYRALALAGVSLAALPTASFAQTAAAPSASAGDNGNVIIVQARRRSEKLQDVPESITAVTSATLQKDNIHNFADITTVVPGLSLVANANGIGASSSIRGVNHDVNVSGDNGTIQYYLNDAPVGSDVIYQTMFDVDAIDVERGPQGTLRGRAAPSGAIAITTHQPNLEEAGATIDGTVGTHDTSNLTFGIGVPIIKDMLAVRVAGVYDANRGDLVTSINDPGVKPSNETRAIRASVRFEPTDWLKANFSYTGLNHENIGFDQAQSFSLVDPTQVASASAPTYGTITPSQRESVEFTNRDSLQKYTRYDWNAKASFAGQDLIYVGSHLNMTYDVKTPQDTGGVVVGQSYVQQTNTSNIGNTHEIRLQNEQRIAGLFDYVVGYFQQTSTAATSLTSPALVELYSNYTLPAAYGGGTIAVPIPAAYVGGYNPLVVGTAINLPATETKEQSFYGHVTFHLGDKAEISGGIRHIKYTDPGQNLYVNGSIVSPATPNNGSPTIYNITANYHFTPDIMAYVSTGSSWRPGAHAIGDFSLGYTSNETAFTNAAPESSKNYEIGLKSAWMDHKVLFNLTYYHQNFTNYPFRLAGNGAYYINIGYANGAFTQGVGQFNFVSAVPVKVDGVEAQLTLRPSHAFTLDSTLSYTDSRLGSSAVYACDNLPYNVTPTVAQLVAALPAGQHIGSCSGAGLPATFQPKWAGNETAEFVAPVGDGTEGFVRGIMSWRGATLNDPLNPFDNVGAYALFNAYIGIRDTHNNWSLSVYGKNIGNVTKITTLNGQPSSVSQNTANVTTVNPARVPESSNIISNYGGLTVTEPREFGLTLHVALGSH